VSDIPKCDLLHTIQFGIVGHLQKGFFHLMKTHEPLNKYTPIWLSVSAYLDHTPKNKSYEEDAQWNGKKMKEMC
jgi:hypothetical protein